MRRIYKEIDRDGDGSVTHAEFIAVFGKDINGESGSYEAKPVWFLKEMAALKSHLNKLDVEPSSGRTSLAPEVHDNSKIEEGEDIGWETAALLTSNAPGSKHLKHTKAQELQFKKKFGMTPGEAVKAANAAASSSSSQKKQQPPASPVSSVRARLPPRPRSAGSVRSGGGGASVTSGHGLSVRSASVSKARASAEEAEVGLSRVEFRRPNEDDGSAAEFSESTAAVEPPRIPRNNIMPFFTEPNTSTPARPATAGSAREMRDISSSDLIAELRERQMNDSAEMFARQRSRRQERPRSAPRSRSRPHQEAPDDPAWDAPTSRFGGFNQGAHNKSTVATKLSRAKKMADVYRQQEMRRKGHSRSRSRSQSAGRTRGGQMESDYWQPPTVLHDGTFRVC